MLGTINVFHNKYMNGQLCAPEMEFTSMLTLVAYIKDYVFYVVLCKF